MIGRVIRRYASFATARIALVIGRWFVLIQSAKHLEKSEFAALAAALSAAEIIRALGEVGVDNFAYARLGALGARLRVTVRTAFLFRICVAVPLMVVSVAGYYFWIGEPRVLPVFLLILVTFVQSTSVTMLQKNASFGKLGILVGITLASSLLVDLLALLYPATLEGMSVLLVTGDCIAAVAGVWLVMPSLRTLGSQLQKARRPAIRIIQTISPKLGPAAFVSLLAIAYSRLDVVVVLPIVGANAQADYSAGWRLTEPLFLFLSILSITLLAELGSASATRARSFGLKLTRFRPSFTVGALLLVGTCIGLLTNAIAGIVIGLEPRACMLAGVLAAAVPFRVSNTLISTVLLRLSRFDRVLHATIINGILIFSLAFALTPLFGVVVVALSALFGEICNTLIQRFWLSKELHKLAAA